MVIIWIITSIVMFSIIVLIHEYGHFKAARIFWVRVDEFWLGIPPRARKLFTDKKGTLFSLNWLPLGGFVKLAWEQPSTFLIYNGNKKLLSNPEILEACKKNEALFDKSWNSLDPETLQEVLEKIAENDADFNLGNKPAWQQMIIILAWVFMNFLLSTFIFSVLFFFWVKPIGINSQIATNTEIKLIPTPEQAVEIGLIKYSSWVIVQPIEWSLALQSWLEVWDVVLSLNSINVLDPKALSEAISKNKNQEIVLSVLKNDSKKCSSNKSSLSGTDCDIPIISEITIQLWEDAKIGAYLWENVTLNENFKYKYWLITSVWYWMKETYNQSILTFRAIWTLIRKIIRPETPIERKEAIEQVSGPIWIVDFITSVLSQWVVFLIIIGAIISINLWVFNLLPIPALDWWRFIFISINAFVRKIFWRKAINDRLEWMIHVGFFIFLILLSILIAYNDILKIYNG